MTPLPQAFRNRIVNADALSFLKQLPDECVYCIVTSPPYYGLRDYSSAGQIGAETSVPLYVESLRVIFDEARRVLRNDGTLWLNLGDSHDSNKNLLLVPAQVALALKADGWILRMDNVWHKTNPRPESVKDRPSKVHEYVYLFSKQKHYFYDQDAVRVPLKEVSIARAKRGVSGKNKLARGAPGQSTNSIHEEKEQQGGLNYKGANRRSVWATSTDQFSGAHFATFPPALIEVPIKAGCPRGETVLDPFMGAGTTALVARRLGRAYTGSEINPAYWALANKRIGE